MRELRRNGLAFFVLSFLVLCSTPQISEGAKGSKQKLDQAKQPATVSQKQLEVVTEGYVRMLIVPETMSSGPGSGTFTISGEFRLEFGSSYQTLSNIEKSWGPNLTPFTLPENVISPGWEAFRLPEKAHIRFLVNRRLAPGEPLPKLKPIILLFNEKKILSGIVLEE